MRLRLYLAKIWRLFILLFFDRRFTDYIIPNFFIFNFFFLLNTLEVLRFKAKTGYRSLQNIFRNKKNGALINKQECNNLKWERCCYKPKKSRLTLFVLIITSRFWVQDPKLKSSSLIYKQIKKKLKKTFICQIDTSNFFSDSFFPPFCLENLICCSKRNPGPNLSIYSL